MGENDFIIQLVAKLNNQLTKKSINNDLKSLNNTMFVRVVAKLSKTISRRELNKQLKELNNLTVNVGTNVKVGKDTKEKIQKNIKMLQKSISDLEIGLKTSKINSDVQSVRNNVQKKINRTPVDLNLHIKKEKAISDIEYIAKRYSKLFSNTSASQKFENILNSAYSISDSKDLSKVRAQISAFTSELKSNGLAAQSTGDKWRKLLDRSKELFSAASVIRTIFMQVKQAVSTTIGLDKVYTDLIKVNSELKRNDYSEYLSKCNKKAQELATTQKALIEGATEFSKSGYDLKTSDKLTEKSTMLSNVGEMSASDSAKAIISGVQAYDVVDGYTDVSDKAQALVDKYNEIGNTASITTTEIAQGVQKVGSVFADANTSVDQLIALGSAGNRQFQDAEALFLGLRTSALRIRGCTAELEEMGEETEGVCTSASKLEEKIKGLTNINGNGGVEILKSDGETFRSIYDIFLDISKVYKDMSDTDQSALLELIAGKHRASAISATLNNMTEAEDILQNSLNAAGSAQKEYDTYLESTEAHIQQFQAKLVETYSTFLNGDMISHVADLGTGLLDLVNKTDLLKHTLIAIATIKIGQGISDLGGVIANTTKQMKTLGSALQQVKDLPSDGALRASEIEKLGESTKSLTEKNLKFILSQKQLSEQDRISILRKHELTEEQAKEKLEKLGLTNATNANTAANAANATSVNGLKGAFTGLTASIKATWTAMSALQKASIIFAAISTTWSVISSVVSSHNESMDEAKEKTKELAEEAIEEEKSLLSLIRRYNELDKTDRSTENTEKIKDLNEQINDVLGTQAEKIDLVNGKLDAQSNKLRRNLLQKLKDDKTEIDASVSVAKGKYDEGAEIGSFFDAWGDIGGVLKEYGATGISQNPKDGRIQVDKGNVGAILNHLNTEQQIQQLEEWIELLNKADKDAGIGTYEDEISSLMEILNKAKKIKSDYDKSLLNQKSNEVQQNILNDSLSGKINDFSAFKNYRNELQKTYSDNSVFRDQMLDFIDNIYPEYAEKVKDTANAVKQTSTLSFKEAWDSIGTSGTDEQKKAALEAKEKLEELAKAGKLTEEAFSNSTIAENFLKQTKISAEEATEKINELVSSADQLKSMKTGISSISTILGEKKENQSSKKTRTKGIDIDTLAGMPEDVKAQTKEYEHFVEVLGDGSSKMKDCKDAANKLATAYVNSNNFLSNLTDENQDYYTSVLKGMGIEKAEKIVSDNLNASKQIHEQKTKALAAATKDMGNKTYTASQGFLEEAGTCNTAKIALADLIAKEKIFEAGSLSTSDKVDELNKLALAYFGVQNAIQISSAMGSDSRYWKNSGDYDKAVKKQWNKLLKKQKKIMLKGMKIKLKPTEPTNPSGKSDGGKDKSKSNSKQEIDWIERRVNRLTSIISKLNAEKENLFSVKKKNSNLNKQIKETTKLIKTYSAAIKKYSKKADSIKLSAPLRKLVENGKIKGGYKKLVKKYGEKTANKIQSYQNWYKIMPLCLVISNDKSI